MRAMIGIGAVLVSALCLQLGFWQLNRAEQAEERTALVREREAREPVLLEGLHSARTELFYRRAVARGRFETKHSFWIEDRKQNGQRGFHQIVPLQIVGSDLRVLVNRGWTARPELPAGLDRELTEIEGLIVRPAVPALRLTVPESAFGDRWPYLDPELYAESRGVPVAPFVLVGDPHLAGELLEAELGRADKWGMHIGYALQWFVFAVLSLLFLIVLGKTRRKGKQ